MLKGPFRGRSIKYMYVCMYVTKFKNQIRLKHGRNRSVRQAASVKGKLRSKNILPYIKAHIPSISKIVVIWCSTDLNFSSGSLNR